MPRSLFVPLLLISCQLAAANYGVLDIFSSDADCATLGPVQASIRREVGICWNVPYGIPETFLPTMFHGKKSYCINSCANTSPFLTASVSGTAEYYDCYRITSVCYFVNKSQCIFTFDDD